MTQQTLALFSNHHLYYWIARSNLDAGKQHEEQLAVDERRDALIQQNIVNATGRPDPDYAGVATYQRVQILEKRCVALTQAAVFAAMAAEAFINFYPRWKRQPNSLLEAVKDLSLVSKWLVIPALLNGGQRLEPGMQPMQDLRSLVLLRNGLVHSVPKSAVSIKDGEFITPQAVYDNYYGPSVDEVEKCVKTVRQLVLALKNIDPAIQTEWLDQERFYSFYPVQRAKADAGQETPDHDLAQDS